MLNRHSTTNLTLHFKREDMLKILKENRETHVQDYQEAKKEYRKQLIETLEKKLAAAKEGEKVHPMIGLTEPVQFTDHYDRAISMLEMTSDETIEMDHVLYAQLAQDEWEWKDQFTNSTLNYTSKAPPRHSGGV